MNEHVMLRIVVPQVHQAECFRDLGRDVEHNLHRTMNCAPDGAQGGMAEISASESNVLQGPERTSIVLQPRQSSVLRALAHASATLHAQMHDIKMHGRKGS